MNMNKIDEKICLNCKFPDVMNKEKIFTLYCYKKKDYVNKSSTCNKHEFDMSISTLRKGLKIKQ